MRFFVRKNPRLLFDRIFAKHRACLGTGEDLVTRPIEEARVDEHDTLAHSANALGEIDRCAPLFVHNTNLERIRLQPEESFDASEQSVGKCDFVRPMHLRFNDVDAASTAIGLHILAATIRHRAGRGDDRIQDTLKDLLALSYRALRRSS